MAANTANRIRIVARASIEAAIDTGAVPADVWPQRSKTCARRKVARTRRSVDVRALPGPALMAAAIDAIGTHQPGSDTYRVMSAVAYYAGLRPSEVVMLRVRSTVLPVAGWGRLEVTEADISFDEPGEPKTGPRNVPIPPVLVTMLRDWIEDNDFCGPDRFLFRTRNDTRPSGSNWIRAWHRALATVGQPPLRVYDWRHAAATTWLRAGTPLAESETPRPLRRNLGLHLRRCPRPRRTRRQPTRRHVPRIARKTCLLAQSLDQRVATRTEKDTMRSLHFLPAPEAPRATDSASDATTPARRALLDVVHGALRPRD